MFSKHTSIHTLPSKKFKTYTTFVETLLSFITPYSVSIIIECVNTGQFKTKSIWKYIHLKDLQDNSYL